MTEQKDSILSEKGSTASVAKVSREPFFGTLLFGCIIIAGVVVLGAIGWMIYHGVQLNQKQAALPSIADLSEEMITPEAVSEEATTKEEPVSGAPQVSEEADLKKAQTTAIKVLNGGASKGSAGTLGDFLKKKMFTQVTIGNTLIDYTGISIYYSPEREKEAGLVREVLLATYPQTETRPSVQSNAETKEAPLTIIVGK